MAHDHEHGHDHEHDHESRHAHGHGPEHDREPIAKLRNQLLRRPAGTVGLVFSRTGFTEPARVLAQFTAPQAILLWSGDDLQFAFESQRICELLTLKYRICVELGVVDYDLQAGEIS